MITNGSITLWHEGVDPKTRMETFTVRKFEGVSMQKDVITNLTDGGLKSANVIKIRIPTEEDILIKDGDKLVTYLSDSSLPPAKDCFTVMTYADNRKGSKKMWHWKVIAK